MSMLMQSITPRATVVVDHDPTTVTVVDGVCEG